MVLIIEELSKKIAIIRKGKLRAKKLFKRIAKLFFTKSKVIDIDSENVLVFLRFIFSEDILFMA